MRKVERLFKGEHHRFEVRGSVEGVIVGSVFVCGRPLVSGRKHQTCACGACTSKATILKSVSNVPRCSQILMIQWFFLTEICTNTHLQVSFWERQFEEVLLGLGLAKVPNWECLFVRRKPGLFLSVYVDEIKVAGRK